jgi:predicted Zn-dependent protease
MAKRAVGGYAFNAEIARARNASRTARESLRRIVDEKPGTQTLALLLAKTALALGEIDQAINDIDQVARNAKPTQASNTAP